VSSFPIQIHDGGKMTNAASLDGESPLRRVARGQPCMCRFVGQCNWDWSTTVLAHIRRAGLAGFGQKPPDTCAVFACSACHDVIDVRTRNRTLHEIADVLLDALLRQHAWYAEREILVVVA
jgi:hypothetical protein